MAIYKKHPCHFFIQCDDALLEKTEIIEHIDDFHQGDAQKHIPLVTRNGSCLEVHIGETTHPMTKDHYISLIFLKTQKGGQYRLLSYQQQPKVCFQMADDDKPLAVYGYCTLHGLWKTTL